MIAIVDDTSSSTELCPDKFSIYKKSSITKLWNEGNPFAWHLHLESVNVYSDRADHLFPYLGTPSIYTAGIQDCSKFFETFLLAVESIKQSDLSLIFDLSSIFLCVRNFATCYSLGFTDSPIFSRDACLKLNENSLNLPIKTYQLYERSRLLCTRGLGQMPTLNEIMLMKEAIPTISDWMGQLFEEMS